MLDYRKKPKITEIKNLPTIITLKTIKDENIEVIIIKKGKFYLIKVIN